MQELLLLAGEKLMSSGDATLRESCRVRQRYQENPGSILLHRLYFLLNAMNVSSGEKFAWNGRLGAEFTAMSITLSWPVNASSMNLLQIRVQGIL